MDRKKKARGKGVHFHAWRQFRDSVRLLGGQKRRYLRLLLSESLLNGLSPIVSLVATQRMLNVLQAAGGDLGAAMLYAAFLSGFTALSHVLRNLLGYWKEREELLFEKNFHMLLLRKVGAMDCSSLENSGYYDLIDRTQYDANAGVLGNIKNSFSFLSAMLGTVSYILVLADYHAFLLAAIILVPAVRYFFEKKYDLLSYEAMRENTEKGRRLTYYFRMLIDADSAKEIRMYGLGGLFASRYEGLKEYCSKKTLDVSRGRMRAVSMLEVLENAIDCLCVMYLAREAFLGRMLVGTFILYSNSIDAAKQDLLNLFLMRSVLYKYASMLEQILGFLSLPEEPRNPGGREAGTIKTLEARHLSYHYPGRQEAVLKDVSFLLRAGEFTVLMGYNGSGKSTLVKILMGIYQDYEGDILVNGVELRELDMEQYRKKISAVFQNYLKFETSIAENVWYGDTSKCLHSEEADRLLKANGMGDLLAEQDGALGYQFCDGRQISLGQWQKLAISRGLFRKADVYILDEPNASLDLLSEESVFRNIEEEAGERIRLAIMHRFNHFVAGAGQILVLDRGRIAEHGSHEELMELRGLYYRLYQAQNGTGQKPVA